MLIKKHANTILLSLLVIVLTGVSVFAQNPVRGKGRRTKEEDAKIQAEAAERYRSRLESQREARRRNKPEAQLPDSLVAKALEDSLKFAADSIHLADSLNRVDSLSLLSKSSLSRPAFSAAKDSTKQVFSNGQRKMYYWGDVTVTYENLKLTADYMEYDMATGTVFARGTYDTLKREWKGQPVMTQGRQTYNMEEVRYNFNTRKARITNMITKEDDGILHGKNIKMMPDKSINITDGKYTVCDLEHPHYYLKLSSAKVMTKPSQKTVFGPAHLVVEDVDLPIAIPFGFIPKRPNRATGMLMPTFGEESARGFYVRDAGMYFVLGDYFDMSLTGDYYTLGSWAADLNTRYMVKYKFSGNMALNYSVDQTGEKGSSDYFQTKNFGVRWSHSQDSKAHPGQTFSASVNFSSPSNSRYNSRSVSEALQNQISSSISFGKNFGGKYNLSVNALHSQNSRDSSYTFTLPNISFSVSRFYPFKVKNRVGKERIYEKFSLAYNTSLQNKIRFKASEFGQEGFLDKFQNGMAHNFTIGLPDFTLLKYLNVTPSVNYGMNWFFRSTEAYFNPETNKVETQMGKAFGHFGATHTYSGSVSMSTRIYGMYNFGRYRKLQAIRHVISPSMGISLSPEKGKAFNGWRTLNYVDTLGHSQSYEYNIFQGQLNSYPQKGRSATMTLTIGNNLEAKMRDMADTTGKGSKKVKLIDQLNFNTGYNFLADSLKMSNVGVTMSTSIFGKLGINGNLNFSPYAVADRGSKIGSVYNRYYFLDHSFPLRLTNFSFSTSYSFSGKGTVKGNDGSKTVAGGERSAAASTADYYRRIYYHPVTGEYIPGGWLYYTNPNVPWSVNLNYSLTMSRSYTKANGQLIQQDKYNQTLGVSGNIQLTPKMSIQAQTGWDFVAMKLTTSQMSFRYDLHCFNISVQWVPTGMYKSYSFLIAANASALADLLRFKKSTSYWDNQ